MKAIVRSHLIVATLSLILLLATIGALGVFMNRIHTREQRVLDARDRLASYDLNKKRLAEESTALEAIRSRATALEKNIVTDDTAPTLLSSIETLAKNDGLQFTLTTVSATTAATDGSTKLHIDFSATGSFANIQHFISDLLAQPYEVQVPKLSVYLSNADKGGTTWQVLAGMDVLSY